MRLGCIRAERWGEGGEDGLQLVGRCAQSAGKLTWAHLLLFQTATRQLMALKTKIPAQVATLNALIRAAGAPAADAVTVQQCLSGELPWEVTGDMKVLRDLVATTNALKRRTEERKYLAADARGLLKFLHARAVQLKAVGGDDWPSNWPDASSPARTITYFPVDPNPRALAGLRSLALAEEVRVLHALGTARKDFIATGRPELLEVVRVLDRSWAKAN